MLAPSQVPLRAHERRGFPATDEKGLSLTNRLVTTNSPYLLLHAENPVDWYPWGEEAFERARLEDRPIFLSVGYTACHWCHVMERESFANPQVAEVLNECFVNVKLDREERPDLDELYMAATQMLAGHGGWPNSVFLTPKLEPFFAGTYFPPFDREGHPGLVSLARALARAWQERREEVQAQAKEVMAALRKHFSAPPETQGLVDLKAAGTRLLEELGPAFDRRHGGFGGAPKFPNAPILALLEELGARGERRALDMLDLTLRQMARGGIFDQVGGGFHRYATDATWTVPHFEKMLDDNGQLLERYARAAKRTGDLELRRTAERTAEFLLRDMRSPEGAFYAALDADSQGREGAFYVWENSELLQCLGPEDATFLAPILGFDGAPNFEGRYWVPRWTRPLWVLARERRVAPEALLAEVEELLARLHVARSARPRPMLDDKLLLDRNGIAVAGLAVASAELGRPEWQRAAEDAARFLLEAFWDPKLGWLHVWRSGRASVPALLADVAQLARALLVLARTTGSGFWLEQATQVADWMNRSFAMPGGAYYTSSERSDLPVRGPDLFDGPVPSGSAVALEVLSGLAVETGAAIWSERLERVIRGTAAVLSDRPQASTALLRSMLISNRELAEANESAGKEWGSRVRSLAMESRVALLKLEESNQLPGGDQVIRGAVVVQSGWNLEPFRPGHHIVLDGFEGRGIGLEELPTAGECYRFVLTVPADVVRSVDHLSLRIRPCGEGRCLPDQHLAVKISRSMESPPS